MKTLFAFFICIISISTIKAQEKTKLWQSDISLGRSFSVTTFLDYETNGSEFSLSSPENADKRILSTSSVFFGRLFGKLPKKGVFIEIAGNKKNDSLLGNVNAFSLGEFTFRGNIKKDSIFGEFFKSDGSKMGNLQSKQSTENKLDYKTFYPKIISVTKNNIYSEDALTTESWKEFDKKLKELCEKANDDIEFYVGFNILSQDLEFSHYNLLKQKADKNRTVKNNSDNKTKNNTLKDVEFSEKNKETAYLKIKNFSSTQAELAKTLPVIISNDYKNLIIDLRNNGGGGVEAAFELAEHLVDQKSEVGYFLSNDIDYKGFNKEKFDALDKMKPKTTIEFIEYLQKEKGAKMVFYNSKNKDTFKGKIYFLVNNNTASTCEPIVYLFKDKYDATIIGKKTAGDMMSATLFDVQKDYKLFLPIADFYTYDGYRIEGKGVLPDIETESDEALSRAIKIINEKNK